MICSAVNTMALQSYRQNPEPPLDSGGGSLIKWTEMHLSGQARHLHLCPLDFVLCGHYTMYSLPGQAEKKSTAEAVPKKLFLLCCVRHKSDMSCSFDRYSERSLMLCTVPGDPSRKNLSSLGNISL